MVGLVGKLLHASAAAVVLSQVCVYADEGTTNLPAVEPVVSAQEVSVVEKIPTAKTEIPPAEELVVVTEPRPLFQHDTYPGAWKAAQKSNRPILVFVSMPNCHYCVKMKQQVYHLPHVKSLVSSSFETIQADRYTHRKLVEKLRIKWYPTTVLVGPNNKVLDVIEGYADAKKFEQRIHTSLASLDNNKTLATRLADTQNQ